MSRFFFILLSVIFLGQLALAQTQYFSGMVTRNSLDESGTNINHFLPLGTQAQGYLRVNTGDFTVCCSSSSYGDYKTTGGTTATRLMITGVNFSLTDTHATAYDTASWYEEVTLASSSFTAECGIGEFQPWGPSGPWTDYTLDVFPITIPSSGVYCGAFVDVAFSGGGTAEIWLGVNTSSAFPKTFGIPCNCAGDPISVATGNLYDSAEDYATSGPNVLELTRFYNSMQDPSSLSKELGYNWRTNFDRSLRLLSLGAVLAERANGQEVTFSSPNGSYTPDSDVDITLTNSGSTWTLTDHDDTVETYTTLNANQAILTSIKSRNGYTQKLSYDANNQLVLVTDSYGRTLHFAYLNGLLQTVTTPDGTVVTYAYTSSGITAGLLDRLASVTYSTTPQTSQAYLYENTALPLALTGLLDENGKRYVTWGYDASGRAVFSYAGSSNTQANATTIQYDDATGNRTVTNALGQSELYQFTTLQGIPKLIEIDRQATSTTLAASRLLTYDNNGYLASQTDWKGNLTTYVNDVHGQHTSIVEAVGTPQTRTTMIHYHPTFHLPASLSYIGISAAYNYDASGNLKTLTASSGQGVAQTRTWQYTWNNYGLLATAQSPRTDLIATTRYTYSAANVLTAITNALGQDTQIPMSTPGGRPETIIDANGVKTQFTYDIRQRLIGKTVQTAAGPLVTRLSYDAAGNLVSTRLPDGSTIFNSYDTAHRLTESKDSLGDYIIYTLDGLGDRTLTNVYSNANILSWTSSGSFDALGRELVHTAGAGQTVTKTYDANGNVLTAEDGLSHTTTNMYDALNRVSTSTDPNLGVTSFYYDTRDRLTKLIDATGHATTFQRDGFGDVIEEVGTVLKKYAYDNNGNLLNRLIPSMFQGETFGYDALDRPVEANYFGRSQFGTASYTYDETGSTHGFGVGRLTSVFDGAGRESYQYDERGNRLSETRTNGSSAFTTSYSYDPSSRIASTIYPDGTIVRTQRDPAGNAFGVTAKLPGASTPTTIAGFRHEPFGPINRVLWANGGQEGWTFDLSYRPTRLADGFPTGTFQSLFYVYDPANNVKSITDGVTPANSQTFGYDLDDRLNSAVSQTGGYGSFAWKYDNVGNRLSQAQGATTTTYGYSGSTNWLTAIYTSQGTTTVSTNNAGEITSITPANSTVPATFTYNAANRLSSVTGSPVAATFVYDYAGQRFSKTDGGMPSTIYSYNQDGAVIAENDGGAVTDYVYVDGRPLAVLQPSSATLANQINYVLADRLGTPQRLVNTSEATTWSTTYQPFGTTAAINASVTQNLRFPGQIADAETGFNYNLNRDYMPNLGRYLEFDPIGLRGGVNIYAYVGANPLFYTDPKGLEKQKYNLLQPDNFRAALNDPESTVAALQQADAGMVAVNNFSALFAFFSGSVQASLDLAAAGEDAPVMVGISNAIVHQVEAVPNIVPLPTAQDPNGPICNIH